MSPSLCWSSNGSGPDRPDYVLGQDGGEPDWPKKDPKVCNFPKMTFFLGFDRPAFIKDQEGGGGLAPDFILRPSKRSPVASISHRNSIGSVRAEICRWALLSASVCENARIFLSFHHLDFHWRSSGRRLFSLGFFLHFILAEILYDFWCISCAILVMGIDDSINLCVIYLKLLSDEGLNWRRLIWYYDPPP